VRYLFAFIAFFLPVVLALAAPAWAQAPVYQTPQSKALSILDQPVTVTATSAVAIPAGNYSTAKFINYSPTDIIYCRWGAAAVAAATAGQYSFAPNGGGYLWDWSDPPPKNTALNCISGGSSSPAIERAF
jgi:hypothetical protein